MITRVIIVDTQAELDSMYSADVQRADVVLVREHYGHDELYDLNASVFVLETLEFHREA